MRFRGSQARNIDPKGRLMLTPEFRDKIMAASANGTVILTKFDGYVVGYPLPVWEDIEERFSNIPNPTRKIRDFIRLFLGSAQEIVIDKQGRVNVPPDLRDYAGIDKEIMLIGVGKRFEIIARERYAEDIEQQEYQDVAPDLAEAGVEIAF